MNKWTMSFMVVESSHFTFNYFKTNKNIFLVKIAFEQYEEWKFVKTFFQNNETMKHETWNKETFFILSFKTFFVKTLYLMLQIDRSLKSFIIIDDIWKQMNVQIWTNCDFDPFWFRWSIMNRFRSFLLYICIHYIVYINL